MAITTNRRRARAALAAAAGVLLMTACAVRPVPDPRNPGVIEDRPVTMRVCIVEGDGAHADVGDQVEFLTSRTGRLRIRHIAGPNNERGEWNDGEPIRVDAKVLVERVAATAAGQSARQRNQQDGQTLRRIVPVGRFLVRIGEPPQHEPFDFRASKTTTPMREHEFDECVADVGDDEIIIRGVRHDDRHGGRIIIRGP